MKVVYRPRALQDLDDIADYYQTFAASTALRVLADIDEVIELLEVQPRSGREIVPGVRRNVSKTYRYVLLSRIEGDVVAILQIYRSQNRSPDFA